MDGGAEHVDVTMARVAALFSLGCGIIHGAVTQLHFDEYTPFGWFFLLVTVFQLAWGLLILFRPASRWLVLGAVVSLAVATVWLWSRTVGIPFGPHAGEAEAVGVRDGFSTVFEVAMVAVLALVLSRRGRTIVPARRAAVVLAVATAAITGATAAAIAMPETVPAEMGGKDEHAEEPERTHVEGEATHHEAGSQAEGADGSG